MRDSGQDPEEENPVVRPPLTEVRWLMSPGTMTYEACITLTHTTWAWQFTQPLKRPTRSKEAEYKTVVSRNINLTFIEACIPLAK